MKNTRPGRSASGSGIRARDARTPAKAAEKPLPHVATASLIADLALHQHVGRSGAGNISPDGISEDIITDLSKIAGLDGDRPQFELHLQGPFSRYPHRLGANSACSRCWKCSIRRAGNRVYASRRS